MSRGPCTFRQNDLTRALRAAFAAGATRAEVKVGEITLTAEKTGEGTGTLVESAHNEWNTPAGKRPQ
jgi:hypothetical protein